MARGVDGKARRKEARKEERTTEGERAAEGERILSGEGNENDFDNTSDDIPFPMPVSGLSGDTEKDGEEEEVVKKKKTKKKKRTAAANNADAADAVPKPVKKDGIKTAPLILLILMTGTTLLPALLYAGDWFGAFIQTNHIFGSFGHKMGIGPSPKKRVLSFYEKHDPLKIDEVQTILSKYYGDYPKLVKRLERKYGDYGYFMDWENDEAPMTLAFDQLKDTRDYLQKKFDQTAPQQLKTAIRNVRYNLNTILNKGKKIWKKKIWPQLEPLFGVPDEKAAAAQKRKDKKEAMEKKGQGRRRKNTEFRDEEDE
eukprot:CAMPEP_0197823272 /NCGR_PEP_ID=MMETSP1437-20131217/584_1 /TAXON_ID=49252 ORGANISM="Eucampia antarctica, Strain CCMP1452" /NCGR_SAMPLE_ID=MMETSP1437 /ASSEMBLY_ACC=CAM_ASM_001096 /LENGTH=311 /DNA_ID=CAMNT_0043422333 /DNA_START=187 /DNA_END=1122 /DNA_ORIENTATION=-